MEKAFVSLAELRTEIDLLKIKSFNEEELLKEKITDPKAIISTIRTYFKSKPSANKQSMLQGLLNQDIVSNISRLVLPFLLNTTLFKKSNFITKAIVTFVSQKAAQKVNTGAINGIVGKVKGWFEHKRTVHAEKEQVRAYNTDYGIPPDSETY